MVSKDGIFVDLYKVKVVLNWKRPTTITEVTSFLRLVRYYRRFIQGFFQLALALTQLTKKDQPFVWDVKYEKSFQVLKSRLTFTLVW